MNAPTLSADTIAALTRQLEEANTALLNGDLPTYLAILPHGDDFTLMPPFGGVESSVDRSPQAVAETAAFFQGGEGTFEVVESYASGDLVVLVVIERQHGRVGGLPDQDLSLRVTLVLRRDGEGWQLVHRHADSIVQRIGLDLVAAMARGEADEA
jgi:ketosteroid isomerase-like protein